MLDPPGNLSSEWGRLLVEGLVAAGLRDVVISPGSRSTPFVLAATGDSRLRCVEIVDERSAAFFALGQARASGRPSLFVCTSGTAGAHAYPAVIEASLARVPLLVLTADRPFERRECGAPQTVDQTRLFGDHVRWAIDLGLPDASERALRSLQRRALQAFARATVGAPGPVHVNAPVRKPLEPSAGPLPPAESESRARLERRVGRIAARAPRFEAGCPSRPSEDLLDRLIDELVAARRPLAVAGPGPRGRTRVAGAFASALGGLGVPLYAEATSQLRSPAVACAEPAVQALAGFAAVLASPGSRAALAPDLVLQIGAAPTAGGWEPALERWCGEGGARHVVLADGGWPDPVSTASWMILGDAGELLAAVAERARARQVAPQPDPTWAGRLAELAGAGARIARELRAEAAEERMSEPAAVGAVLEALPPDALFAVGNSLPVRSVDLFAPEVDLDGWVWSQRGANGIDGLVSGVAGSLAILARERPSALGVLLVGDVSLRHDLGGLATLRHLESGSRLVVVLLDNGGGRIFDQLPAHALELGDRWRFWSTPTDTDWAAAAAAFGVDYREAATREDAEHVLRELLGGPSSAERSTLLRLAVEPESAKRSSDALRRRLEEWVAQRSEADPQTGHETGPQVGHETDPRA